MPELVGMCLGYVDPLTQPVCRAVCRRWHHALQPHAQPTQTETTTAVTATPSPAEKGLPGLHRAGRAGGPAGSAAMGAG
jgi:hypothetical protein